MSEGRPVLWTGQLAVVTLPREIDSSNSGQIGEQLLFVINRGAAVLVADMTGTVSCDYSGRMPWHVPMAVRLRTGPGCGWWSPLLPSAACWPSTVLTA